MKLEVFDIELDNPKRVFNAGTTLSGHVFVHMTTPTPVKCLAIQVLGSGEVFWTSRSAIDSSGNVFHPAPSRFIRNYKHKEVYLKVRRVLYENNDDEPMLSAGSHTYEFQVSLPAKLPSSILAGYGKVRYSIKATVTRPWKMMDDEVKRSFTVIGKMNLNNYSNIMYPQAAAEEVTTRGCMCTKSGNISATLRIDRRGYVPGEYISLEGEVSNNSKKPIKSTRVQLRMVIHVHFLTFHSSGKSTKTLTRVVSSSRRGVIQPKSVESWTGKKIHILPLPPSPLLHCNIISIEYYVVLMVEPSRLCVDIEVPINVLIGTVPLQNVSYAFAKAGAANIPIVSDDDVRNKQEWSEETTKESKKNNLSVMQTRLSYRENPFGNVL